MSRYGVISGPYFPAFGLNTERYGVFSPNVGKYGSELNPHLDTFHGVIISVQQQFSHQWKEVPWINSKYSLIENPLSGATFSDLMTK